MGQDTPLLQSQSLHNKNKSTQPYYGSSSNPGIATAPPPLIDPESIDLEREHPFPKTVFIDTLTTKVSSDKGESNQDDNDAIARIDALRGMRFKPHQEYAAQIQSDRAHNMNTDRKHDLHYGVHFLKPLDGFPTTFKQSDFKSSNVTVVNHGFFSKLRRWATVLLTTPLGWIRAAAKSKLIEEGEFGYAKDANGNIEIYNSGKGYQTGLSLWTNITKVKVDSDYVNMFGRIHMVKVKEGEYAVGDLNGRPVILPPGRHMIESSQFTLKTTDAEKTKPHYFKQTDYVVKHGNTHIIRVPEGRVARAKLGSRIVILEPEYSEYDKRFGTGLGAYVVHDKNFELLDYVEPAQANQPNTIPSCFKEINKPVVDLDPARVLTVPQTKAAVVEHNGKKIFLRGGRYALPDATYVYKEKVEKRSADGTVSLGQDGKPIMMDAMYDLTDQLITISTADEKSDKPLMSNDKIRLQVEAKLLFTVVDVKACDLKVGITDYIENTRQRARNKLYELVSKGNYLQPITAKNPRGGSSSSNREVEPYNEEFARRQITADFANQVYEELSKELDASSGIRLEKVLITSLTISDPEIRKKVESEASQVAEANADLSKAEISQKTDVLKAETEKAKALIEASREAEKLVISTKSKAEAAVVQGDAENTVIEHKAKTEMNISKQKAETEAGNTLTLAQAKADLVVKMAEADKKADTLRAEGLKNYEGIRPDNLGYSERMVNATGQATRDMLKGANLNLISNDAKNVGNMLLNSVAGTLFTGRARPDLSAEVVYPVQQQNTDRYQNKQ